ncbi:MAG: UDP-N-acetylglucosamine 1-carboxyvinyltransferase [Planctomycetota bacterium]
MPTVTGPSICVTGGEPLRGTVRVSGSKNASLPLMAAALLADGPSRLRGVPDVTDVAAMSSALRQQGARVTREGDDLVIAPGAGPIDDRDPSPTGTRGTICLLGPLLARGGTVTISRPGGCAIGPRPVDLHVAAMRAFGADVEPDGDQIVASATRLRGAEIDRLGPHGPSVTGTANALMAATGAHGETVIRHAAREPEIVTLAATLTQMGAEVTGAGTATIRVAGRRRFRGFDVEVPPDRIEAGTWMLAAVATGGRVRIERAPGDSMRAVTAVCLRAGADVSVDGAGTPTVSARPRPHAVSVTARPYPGLPTDLQPQLTAAMLRGEGTSALGDAVFPTRFGHLAALSDFGGQVLHADGEIRISGVDRIRAATVRAGDLRGAAAILIAALSADGPSRVDGVEQLDRGYEAFVAKAVGLGGDVGRVGPVAAAPAFAER